MNKKNKLLTAGSVLLSVLLVVTVVYIFRLRNETSLYQESLEIQRIDELLRNGFREDAENAIRLLSKKDLSAVSHIRLLKRALRFSENTDDRALLLQTAERAYEAFPAGNEIAAVYIYSLLRSGKRVRAIEVYERADLDGEKWKALENELSLYLEPLSGEELSGEKLSGEENLRNLSEESGAERFADLYQRTGSSGFLQDALLLYLREGQVDTAYGLLTDDESFFDLQGDAAGELPPELLFFISYDARDWETADKILMNRFELFSGSERKFLEADILMHRSRYDTAAEIYRDILKNSGQDAPEFTITGKGDERALFNLAWIDIKDDGEINGPDADFFLGQRLQVAYREGTRRPENEEAGENDFGTGLEADSSLPYQLAELMIAHNRSLEAEHFMSLIPDHGRDTTKFQLLEEHAGPRVNPARYASLLWRMADRPEYATHLGWFLLGVEDISGLRNLVILGEKKYGSTYWTHFFQGVIDLYTEDYQSAADNFLASHRMRRHWSNAYNAALSLAADGKMGEALKSLETAELVLAESGLEGKDTEAVQTVLLKRAEFLLYLRNYSAAESVLSRIEELSPLNLHADILRGMLAGEVGD